MPCSASWATDGSLARRSDPAGVEATVRLGSKPERQFFPASVEVAKPMPVAPPPTNLPDWKAVTTVPPDAALAGSTSV
jgi:hypothetical protein